MMPVKVRFPLELLLTWRIARRGGTRMRVLALWIVRLHVRLPIVAPLEQLATDSALVGRFFRSGSLPLLLDTINAWYHRLIVESWKTANRDGLLPGQVSRAVSFGTLCLPIII